MSHNKSVPHEAAVFPERLLVPFSAVASRKVSFDLKIFSLITNFAFANISTTMK